MRVCLRPFSSHELMGPLFCVRGVGLMMRWPVFRLCRIRKGTVVSSLLGMLTGYNRYQDTGELIKLRSYIVRMDIYLRGSEQRV